MPDPIGYPDFRRQYDRDGPSFVSEAAHLRNGPFTYGPFFVGSFDYLAGRIQVTTNPVLVTLTWYADAAMTQVQGTRNFVLDGASAAIASVRILNLGRFVTIVIDPGAAINWTISAQLFPSNRPGPVEFQSFNPYLAIFSTGALAGGGSVPFAMDYLWAGPVQIALSTSAGTNSALVLTAETTPGTFVAFDQIAGVPLTSVGARSVFPPTGVRATLFNTGGVVSGFSVGIFPSTSGAS